MSLTFGRPYHGETTNAAAGKIIAVLNETGLTNKEIIEALDIVKYQLDCAMLNVRPELQFFVIQE